ncbi:MAG: mRNA surveillance protein pelota [Candidatus Micrarchaeaceae archaeon]
MKVIRFRESENTLIAKLDTVEDLWAMQRIIFPGDLVKSKSLRRFKPTEGSKGELKEVTIRIRVEKVEFDRASQTVRFIGMIVEGKPMEYIRLNSHHTLNISPGDIIEVTKGEWHDYLMDVVRNAVQATRRPRLGVIAIDDEKALFAYILGYGIDFGNEVYSSLSKRLSNKDFQEALKKYFESIEGMITNMDVDTIIIAGPGFTKDDFKKYMEDTGFAKRVSKRLIYFNISNVERSGVYELIKSEDVAKILHGEAIRKEFMLMEEFLKGLASGKSKYGVENVGKDIRDYETKTVLVNDSVLSAADVQKVLAEAEKNKIEVTVFNSDDEVGRQLHSFKDIACI